MTAVNKPPLDSSKLLSERALRTRFKARVWSGNKKDDKLQDELVKNKGIKDTKLLRVNKTLLPTATILKQIKKVAGKARNYHYSVTRAWDDAGGRLLPTALYTEHVQKFNEYKLQFDHLVKQFLDNFDQYKQEAIAELGDAWKASDYPYNTAFLARKFELSLTHTQIPTVKDFRVQLSPSQIDQIKEQMEQNAIEALKASQKSLYQRLYDLVAHMAMKLADPKAKFKNSLTGNIEQLVNVLDGLNIEQDPVLQDFGKAVQPLGQLNPDELRKNTALRADMSLHAKNIARDIYGHLQSFDK